MQSMVIDNFLDDSWLSFVRAEIRKWNGELSREGYNNARTMRDSLDPRYAETAYINDRRNILCKVWDKFLWGSPIEEDMANAEDSALVHATWTRFGRTLLSSYGQNDGYGQHVDVELDCVATCVLMLTLGERKFTGGNLMFGKNPVDFENNRLVIFPSCRMHGVSHVNMHDKDIFENRRFTLQYFISSVTAKTRFPDESYPQ